MSIGAFRVALAIVQDKVLICELIATEAVVWVVWQACQAWQVACESESKTRTDLIN